MARKTRVAFVLGAVAAVMMSLALVGGAGASTGSEHAVAAQPDFGPNVLIFDPSMDTSAIQSAVDGVAAQQVDNQFGSQRYALLFKPGSYGTADAPLNFPVGYYTAVAGLGRSPGDVVLNGSAYVRNQCGNAGCVALDNFWRSLSNLTINVTTPGFGCYSGEFWAVSQAAPMRRVNVNGLTTLMDYCTGPSYASGGFIADSQLQTVVNGSQQQFMTRNSSIGGWTNGVWNQVFAGVTGAPDTCFPASSGCGPYTTVASTPVTREAPYLYVDDSGAYSVFVPSAQSNATGTSWSSGPTPGTSIPISKFFIAKPTDSAAKINNAVNGGLDLILTPGVYHLDQPINVNRSDAVVLGLGFPTLIPDAGTAAMKTAPNARGVMITGVIFDAGAKTSPVLLQVGNGAGKGSGTASDPTTLSDVFFRIGGAGAGSATTALVVNSNNVILDDIWAWRADHGTGVGWTSNTSDTGVVVNGDNVTAYGLFVEHFQKTEVIWNGNGGSVYFFQNEMPYDVPSQSAWMSSPTAKGYPAFKVASGVRTFTGYGMGSYSFFNQGVDIYADNAFEVPSTLPAGSLHDLLTIFLDATNGKGGILDVVNGTGGSSTVANPDVPVTVVSYP
jgi:hypothetical protein